MGQSHRDEGLQGTVPGHGDTGYTVGLVLSTTISQVNSIKCYMDNQGIPVAEEPYIIPDTKEYDGEMLIYRNCGVLEEKSGCQTDAANVTRCYCSTDYCNKATSSKSILYLLSILGFLIFKIV